MSEQELPLAAAEIDTLLMHPQTDRAFCLKLLLVELVVCRALEIVPAKRRILGLPRGDVQLLAPGRRKNQPLASPLRHVVQICSSASADYQGDSSSGIPLTRFAYELYDSGMPDLQFTLAERGLLVRESSRHLRVFRTTRWALTESGRFARDELGQRVSLAVQKYAAWREDKDIGWWEALGQGQPMVPVKRAGGLLLAVDRPLLMLRREKRSGAQPGQTFLDPSDADPITSDSELLSAGEFEVAYALIEEAVDRAMAKWVNNA